MNGASGDTEGNHGDGDINFESEDFMMTGEYSGSVQGELNRIIADAGPLRQPRKCRHDPGECLEVEITGIMPSHRAKARLEIEQFVGGGFAGQVYQARLADLACSEGEIPGLVVGQIYKLKILLPPSRFSRIFRNLLYFLGYQASFLPQYSRAAIRSGSLWCKLIRRGARAYLGDERAVADTYATFFDSALSSFAEIDEWVVGRFWRLELDKRLFARRRWKLKGDSEHLPELGSREYLDKRRFMAKLVSLFHDMGAGELARQYEWWTGKSQPNVLKRQEGNISSGNQLTAIDLRPGLALLPYLPMSLADFRLIFRGMLRRNFVQFDRGNLGQLERFIARDPSLFADLQSVVCELRQAEAEYRGSQLDLSAQALRLISSRPGRRSLAEGTIGVWSRRGLLDQRHREAFLTSRAKFFLFSLLPLLPGLGSFLRHLWGNASFRRHLGRLLTSFCYLRRSVRARQAETLLTWIRSGAIEGSRARVLLARPIRFFLRNCGAGWLPGKCHRFLAEPRYAWEKMKNVIVCAIRLYRDQDFRIAWLREQVEAGTEEGMLTGEEKEYILEHVDDPYIQKYLKSLAVHMFTLPLTQVVAVVVALYAVVKYGNTWGQALAYAAGTLAVFQALPISPGSLARGTYVLYLVVRERSLRDYWVAVLVSFWHYIGYLAFPLQMVTKYPALSRFLAGRWATSLVRIVPVFGERGALLEHWVFDFFFNLPISLRPQR